ncbi:class II fumarate hydratase [Alteromonas sp. A079]|uniref:class II fumarate hydratase n=1 Tax=Alteromonas sp. A079 TaxID=3410268 RepID=UPI003B9F4D86
MTNGFRTEQDSMGSVKVPVDALYGSQTQRALNNFPVSGMGMPRRFIEALVLVKKAAAKANSELGAIDSKIGEAIVSACEQLLGDPLLLDHFPVDVFQTGSGTSTNMNANEVIATLANKGTEVTIHPNDHVNYGQSSNDVIPTTIHVSASKEVIENLLPALDALINVIDVKAATLTHMCKTGRTHLMDAMPITLSQSLSGWSSQLRQQQRLLTQFIPVITAIAQGGTAVGTGINAPAGFASAFSRQLSTLTGISFSPADNFFSHIASQDSAVSLSGLVKSLAVTLMKIANDLRWMNSGPLSGLGEIALPAVQPGSSIMPGKVNPVIPESVAMAAAQVIGNDAAITVGGQSGNFELNVMLPMIANNLLQSITLMANSMKILGDSAIKDFVVQEGVLENALRKNPILVTALNPIIGYARAAEIAKKAYKEARSVIDVASEMTDIPRDELVQLLDPVKLAMNNAE